LTPEEAKAEHLYLEAMKFLSKGRQATNEMNKIAYRWLDEAANLNHTKSMELIGRYHFSQSIVRFFCLSCKMQGKV
jgi:hypothetical protein